MIVLVTGGSSGIGAATSMLFAQAGDIVYAASRSGRLPQGADPSKIRAITLDVTVPESIEDAVKAIVDEHGRLDVVVCNAGNGIAGAVEETSGEEARYQFETCFFGAHNTIKACLPIMRCQGSGRIICTSSVAAVVPIPYQAFYSAAKSALLSMVQALSLEVKAWGIQCCCILPGDTKTDFTAARKYTEAATDDSPYAQRRNKAVHKMEKDELNGLDAKVMGKAIVRQAHRRKMDSKCVPTLQYKTFNLLMKVLPARFALWILGKVY